MYFICWIFVWIVLEMMFKSLYAVHTNVKTHQLTNVHTTVFITYSTVRTRMLENDYSKTPHKRTS